MMRIAVFTELYAPSVGGQEVFFAGLSRALLRRGHQLDVYCIGHDNSLAAHEVLDGVNVNRLQVRGRYKQPKIAAMRRNWAAIASFAWHVRSIAMKRDHDVYLLNQWPLLHALAMPRHASRRALLHWCEARHSAVFRIVQSLLPRRVRLNAAISDSVGSHIRAASGRTVMTLPSGLDLVNAAFRPKSERSDIVVIGRVAPHKNVALAVAAFEILLANGYTGRLKIAGDGPDMPSLCARIAASPAAGAIDVLGYISDATKFKLLAQSSVLAMPSRREGFPHVVSEAMCCGLPIVTADFVENGTRAVVQKYASGVVTGQSAQAFAAGITEALAKWDVHSANGRAAASTLDWNVIAERLETELVNTLR